MKNYYDKVLFILALIILGIGVGIFFQKGGVEKGRSIPALVLSGKPYEIIPRPDLTTSDVSWPKPPDQGEDNTEVDNGLGWVYYPFTPPKIYWDKEFGFTAETPEKVGGGGPHINPFGMKFVKAGEELYRVQVTGVGGTGEKDDIIVFSDEENEDQPFHLSLKSDQDAESTEHQVKLLDVSFEEHTDHGLVSKAATVKILDERTNQEVTLTQGKPYSPSGNRYWLLHTEDPLPSEDWRITAVGDKREYAGDLMYGFTGTLTYEVTALDFDKPSVTVVRHAFNKRKVAVESKPTELPPPGESSDPSLPADPQSDSQPPTTPLAQPTTLPATKTPAKPPTPAVAPAAKAGAKAPAAASSASVYK